MALTFKSLFRALGSGPMAGTPPTLSAPTMPTPGVGGADAASPLQFGLSQRLGLPAIPPAAGPGGVGGFVDKYQKPLSMLGKTALGAYQVYSDYEDRKARRDEERRRREEADRQRRAEEAAGQAMAPVGAQLLAALSRRLGAPVGGP